MSRPVSSSVALCVAAAGIGSYAAMDTAMKGLSLASGAYSAVLWRSIAGVAMLAPIHLMRGGRWPGRPALALHVARGAIAGASVILFFWGLVRVPMAQGVALTFLAPLIALFLAGAMLGERIRRAAVGGSLIASLGVLAIAAGQVQARASEQAVLGSVAILIASFLYAGSLILLRRQAQIADPLEVALFTSIVLGMLLLAGAPWFAEVPAAGQVPMIVLTGVLGSASAVALAWAYRHAEAQVLAPVEYTAFAWAALFGWLAFGERVSPYTVAGAVLIIGGCLVAVRRPAIPPTELAA
ncbi:DMT family transporter [Sphingomonas sp. 1P08PE]|uniref:DMT family transporter n=1 Tax=Sphingomonas sp. 1P08PE TaxID=554122 RepID=UPI0039A0B6E8